MGGQDGVLGGSWDNWNRTTIRKEIFKVLIHSACDNLILIFLYNHNSFNLFPNNVFIMFQWVSAILVNSTSEANCVRGPQDHPHGRWLAGTHETQKAHTMMIIVCYGKRMPKTTTWAQSKWASDPSFSVLFVRQVCDTCMSNFRYSDFRPLDQKRHSP